MREQLKDLLSSNKNLEKYFKLKNIFSGQQTGEWLDTSLLKYREYEFSIQSINLLCSNFKNYVEIHTFSTSHYVKTTEKWVLVQEDTSAKDKAHGNFCRLIPNIKKKL